jgi:hypothetical protein
MKKPFHGGVLGCACLHRDHEYDLSRDVLKKIPADRYEVIPAPWDRHKDPEMLRRTEAEARAKELAATAGQLQSELDRLNRRIEQLTAEAAAREEELGEAKEKANAAVAESKKLSSKKQLSENEKKKLKGLQARAYQLAAITNRKGLEQQKVQGELFAAVAEHGLKQLDLEATKKEAEKAAKEFEQLKAAQAKAKPERAEDAEPKTTKAEAGQAGDGSQKGD